MCVEGVCVFKSEEKGVCVKCVCRGRQVGAVCAGVIIGSQQMRQGKAAGMLRATSPEGMVRPAAAEGPPYQRTCRGQQRCCASRGGRQPVPEGRRDPEKRCTMQWPPPARTPQMTSNYMNGKQKNGRQVCGSRQVWKGCRRTHAARWCCGSTHRR